MKLEHEISQSKPFRNAYHRASVNLIYTGKWVIKFHHEIFNAFGLTTQQYNILRILRGQYPKAMTVKLIRERMIDKMSDASRIVENLRKKGLVKRIINSNDRRRMDIFINKKGLNIMSKIDKENNRMDKFLKHLNKKEIKQLNLLLDKLRE